MKRRRITEFTEGGVGAGAGAGAEETMIGVEYYRIYRRIRSMRKRMRKWRRKRKRKNHEFTGGGRKGRMRMIRVEFT